MSDSPDQSERPDWRRMQPGQFTERPRASQDALFLTDDPDACGTETLDGFGFGATLWASPPGTPPAGSDPLAE